MSIPPEILSELESEKQGLEVEKKLLEDQVYKKKLRIREIETLIRHATILGSNWAERAMNCFRGATEPLTTDELLKCILSNSPGELENLDRRRNYIQKLSLTLNRLCAKGLIAGRAVEGVKGKLYYLKSWEDDQGEFKTEHGYKYEYKLKKIKAEKNRAIYE